MYSAHIEPETQRNMSHENTWIRFDVWPRPLLSGPRAAAMQRP